MSRRNFEIFTGEEMFRLMKRAETMVFPGVCDSSDALAAVINEELERRGKRLFKNDTRGRAWKTAWQEDPGPPTHEALLVGEREVRQS